MAKPEADSSGTGDGREGILAGTRGENPAHTPAVASCCAVEGQYLAGRAVGQNAPGGVEDDHPVDQIPPDGHAVLDHHEGRSGGLQGARHRLAHLDHPVRIEVRRRFVQQQQPRPHREGSGERQPLLLPAGQRGRRMAARQVEPHGIQCRVHPPPDLVPRHTQVLAAERDVVADPGQHHLGIRVLQHETHGPARGRRRPPVDEQLALLLALVLRRRARRRALAAGWTCRLRMRRAAERARPAGCRRTGPGPQRSAGWRDATPIRWLGCRHPATASLRVMPEARLAGRRRTGPAPRCRPGRAPPATTAGRRRGSPTAPRR